MILKWTLESLREGDVLNLLVSIVKERGRFYKKVRYMMKGRR